MSFSIPQFSLAITEIVLLSTTCVAILLEVFKKHSHKHLVYYFSLIVLALVCALSIVNIGTETIEGFNGEFIKDSFGEILKAFIYLIVFFVFVFSRNYLEDRGFYRGEFYILGLLGTLGMSVMVSSADFIMLYIGLETSALAMYAMIAMNRDNARAIEAAMKYFILGSMASGVLLFGVSMIYGTTGSLEFSGIAEALTSGTANYIILSLGVSMLVLGLVFKLGGAPFHMWLPDVYDGSPTVVTMYLAAAPKLAAFAILYRTLAEGLIPAIDVWRDLLVIVVVLSLIIGNVVAIAQTSFKRMLAYSTVAHVGFILLGFQTGSEQGYSSSLLYVIVYAITTLVAFGIVVVQASKHSEADSLDDFKGLGRRHPWFALITMIVMLSLAGIPPTVGFYAKFLVLQSAVSAGHTWLAVLAVVMSIVGAFYYLRVIKLMFFDESDASTINLKITSPIDQKVSFSLLGIAILYFGIWPTNLVELCVRSISG